MYLYLKNRIPIVFQIVQRYFNSLRFTCSHDTLSTRQSNLQCYYYPLCMRAAVHQNYQRTMCSALRGTRLLCMHIVGWCTSESTPHNNFQAPRQLLRFAMRIKTHTIFNTDARHNREYKIIVSCTYPFCHSCVVTRHSRVTEPERIVNSGERSFEYISKYRLDKQNKIR